MNLALWIIAIVLAVGLALVMAGAVVVHARRKEPVNIAVNVVLIALAVVVAAGRSGLFPVTS